MKKNNILWGNEDDVEQLLRISVSWLIWEYWDSSDMMELVRSEVMLSICLLENDIILNLLTFRGAHLESRFPLRKITGVPKEFWVSFELSSISSAMFTIVSLLSKSFLGASSDMEKFSSMELAVLSEASPNMFWLS